ncbi:MAG: HRDC domain-containing protein [Pseudomonadota bacterium]
MPEYQFVDRASEVIPALSAIDQIGLDTEFMREKTYFAELSLVQLSTPAGIYCLDPLAADDMAEFWAAAQPLNWVIHSGRQDIEVVTQTAEVMPATVFDTQVAAGLLGYAPQIGYANLVSQLFGTSIAKSQTRADWSKRPLSKAQLAYAAEDVEYLLPAAETLSAELERKGRLAWAEEDSQQLLNPALYETDPELAIHRLKGARNLRGRTRAVAAGLAAWRESQALRANRPRQWIARDSALMDIIKALPTSMDELTGIESLPPGLVRRAGKHLLSIVADNRADESGYQPPPKPTEAQKRLLKDMQKHVATRADELGIAAETLASKKELSAVIIGGSRDTRLLDGWRREFVGEKLLAVL